MRITIRSSNYQGNVGRQWLSLENSKHFFLERGDFQLVFQGHQPFSFELVSEYQIPKIKLLDFTGQGFVSKKKRKRKKEVDMNAHVLVYHFVDLLASMRLSVSVHRFQLL